MAYAHRILPNLSFQESQRFWSKVKQQPNGCWEWQTGLQNGYGAFAITRRPAIPKSYRAHRIAYALYYLKDPQDLLVCHVCDNKKCVNPLHLFLGTTQENTMDKVQKGRSKGHNAGERNGGRKLTLAQVRKIRRRYRQGTFQRDLAVEFGISQTQISRIVNRLKWQHT